MTLPDCFKPNFDCVNVLTRVRAGILVEEYEVGQYIDAGLIRETDNLCNPYELTEDGQEALRRA